MLNENISENNCYLNCNDNYYYFDSNNNYQCTTTKQCPSGQNKLIRDKNKCIDSCINDNKYKYEYNNECVEACPNGFFPENYICKYNETDTITNEYANENTAQETYKNTEIIEKTEESENAVITEKETQEIEKTE